MRKETKHERLKGKSEYFPNKQKNTINYFETILFSFTDTKFTYVCINTM